MSPTGLFCVVRLVLRLVARCTALECLHCSGLECMDDGMLREMLAAGPTLRLVDVSQCVRLTAAAYEEGRARGTPRAHSPPNAAPLRCQCLRPSRTLHTRMADNRHERAVLPLRHAGVHGA